MKTGFLDRVTLCSSCGAPLQAPADAALVRCGKCGAESRVALRVDDAVSAGWSESELARLAHLRSQERDFRPEPQVVPLVAGMRLNRALETQAFGEWQRLRANALQSDVARERAFAQLTALLAWSAAESSEPHRERGLLETALGVVRAPRHCQMLRALLAVLACRMGDPEGAESWLALCDPRAADLRSDSYYRFARAFLDTALGRLPHVLTLLGGNDVEVPFVDELLGPASLLRAHAWERLGRVETAVDLLIHTKFEGDPFGQQLARSFLGINERMSLCPLSEPRAEKERQLSLGRRRIEWTLGMVVVLGMALHFVVSGGVLALFGAASLYAGDAGGLLAFLFAFICLVPAALFVSIFWGAWQRTRRQRALLAQGEIAPARMSSVSVDSQTPALVSFSARVWVAPDREPPFELDTTVGSSPERFAELASGRPFTVRYRGRGILIEPVLR